MSSNEIPPFLDPARRIPILGEVLGGSGNIIFTGHGALLDAYHYLDGEFVPVVGQFVSDPIRMTVVADDRLFVLTDFGVQAFLVEEFVFSPFNGMACRRIEAAFPWTCTALSHELPLPGLDRLGQIRNRAVNASRPPC